VKKGSEEYVAANKELGQVNARMKNLREEIGLTALTSSQLKAMAGGGPVQRATIGLIGEAGPELVIPNWMYSDPKQANLMGFLEAQIASQGNAFATGGSTTKTSSVVAGPDASTDEPGQLVDLMQQFVKCQQEFRDEISDWQRNIKVNLDPRKAKRAIDVATQVMSGGGLR
jgi:hypothetical protein